MHDTFLFKNISDYLNNVCREHQIKKLTYIEVNVHLDSHIDEDSLFHYLEDQLPEYIKSETMIKVNKLSHVEELTAIIKKVEGDS